MGMSIPTALVAVYAVYCETKVRQLEQKRKMGDIFFLKTVGFPYRMLIYVLNTGIAYYNYMTGFDDYFMAALLILSMNIVTNISKIVVEPGMVTIGNTKMKQDDFQLVELKKLDDKNAKFTFATMIRKRRIQRDLYLPNDMMEPLSEALKAMKQAKTSSSKKKK